MDNIFLTTQESAKKMMAAGLHYGADDVAELARRSVFPGAKKVGNIWQIPVQDIEHFLQERLQQRKRTRRLRWLSVSSIAAIFLFIFAALGGLKDFLDLIAPYYVSAPTAIAVDNSPQTATPTKIVTPSTTLTPVLPSETSTSISAPTKESSATPTQTLILTATPLNTSTPEETTRAFLDALQRGDPGIELAASLVSSYTLELLNANPEEIAKQLQWARDLKFDYEIGEVQMIDDKTIWVHVSFDKHVRILDCCVLRQEDGKWRINYWISGEDLERNVTEYGMVIDYRVFDSKPVPSKEVNMDVQIRYITRTTQGIILSLYVDSTRMGSCVVWAWNNQTIATIYPRDGLPVDVRGPQEGLVFEENHSYYQSIPFLVGEFSKAYPIAIDLTHWASSQSCNHADPGDTWSYRFQFQDTP